MRIYPSFTRPMCACRGCPEWRAVEVVREQMELTMSWGYEDADDFFMLAPSWRRVRGAYLDHVEGVVGLELRLAVAA